MNDKPEAVRPGQIWKDNDQRTKNAGEFTVVAVIDEHGVVRYQDGLPQGLATAAVRRVRRLNDRMRKGVALVDRGHRLTTVSTYRMLTEGNSRGYSYLGMSR